MSRPGLVAHADSRALDRALGNFYAAERNGNEPFRWSAPQAQLILYGLQDTTALLRLRLAAARPTQPIPALVKLTTGERQLATISIASDWRRYELLVPTDQIQATVVQFESTPYTTPSDNRELGVVLSALASFPIREHPLPLPPIRGLFLLPFPLLSWLVLKRLNAAESMARVLAGLVVVVVGWAAANPTAAGYWFPTVWWPWLPILPCIFLVGWSQLSAAYARIVVWAATRAWAGWGSLAMALAGLAGIRLGLPALVGMSLLIIGAILAAGIIVPHQALETLAMERPNARVVGLSLLGITILALCLRLINLDGQPMGLWRDESRHGLQALAIWEDPTYRPVYVVLGADLPALLFYLMAPILGMFGPHAWSARLVSALAGACTPLALFWAAGPLVGKRTALCAAFLLAAASWSLSMSRWAFPATLDHLLVLTAIGCLWRGLELLTNPIPAHSPPRKGMGYALLASAAVAGGLATYAYHTGRMAPIALGVVATIYLGRRSVAWRRAWPGLLIAALVGLAVMMPLLLYIGSDLEGYNRRVGAVAVFESNEPRARTPLQQILQNVERYALMWHVRGEANGRHHMPFAPMLDPLTGLLLMIGLVLAIPRVQQARSLLAILGLWLIYFVPGILSGGAPHAMRSLGTLAPACVLASLALTALFDQRRYRLWLYALTLVGIFGFNTWLYYGVMASEPRVYRQFDLVETSAGRIAQQAATTGIAVYMPAKLAQSDTVLFLTHGIPIHVFTEQPIPPGPAIVLLAGNASPVQQAAARAALGVDAVELTSLPHYPDTGQPMLVGFERRTP